MPSAVWLKVIVMAAFVKKIHSSTFKFHYRQITYLIAENWLNRYAYHINIPTWVFPLTLLVSAILVMHTSAYGSYCS